MGLLSDKLSSTSNQDDLLDESQVGVSRSEISQIEQSGSDDQNEESSSEEMEKEEEAEPGNDNPLKQERYREWV